MFSVLLCAVLLSGFLANGARILGIVPSPAYSHQHTFHPIWRELSLRGHSVTVVTTDPVNAPELTNLTQIDVSSAYEYMLTFYDMMQYLNMFNTASFLQNTLNSISEYELSHPEVQKLIKSDQPFDVVLTESSFPEFLAFGQVFRCPTILISSMELQSIIHVATGNPAHPVLNPEFVLPLYGKLSFIERVVSSLYQLLVNYFRLYKAFPQKQQILTKHFGDSIPPVIDMIRNVDMVFVSVNPVLHDVRALGPTTITFGGIHLKSPQALPTGLEKFLGSATEGFIYFSLGTNVQSHLLTKNKIKIILETFKDLPYKVLWKYTSDDLPDLPKNVKIMKWVPQQDVLRHRNIKLFFTQGGLQSTEEAITYNVPMLVMPFFGDQPYNAKRLEYKKVAKIAYHKDLKKETLTDLISEVIKNPFYKDNTKILAKLARDEPMTGLQKVVWWTEYVIRNQGAKHLKNPAVDLPWYQYYLLDVAALLVAIVVILLKLLMILKKAFVALTASCYKALVKRHSQKPNLTQQKKMKKS